MSMQGPTKEYYTIEQLAEITQSKPLGDLSYQISGVDNLESATKNDASFLANMRYEKAMHRSQAGVIFVDSSVKTNPIQNYLISDNPSRAFQKVVELFLPPSRYASGFKGIHPTAIIHKTAQLEENVTVGPYAVIDQRVHIAEGSHIGAHASIGAFVTIGKNCYIHPHVTIREQCHLGNEVILQPGVVIGSCGFGYTTDQYGRHNKLEQIGNVTIEDYVEIGANTTIDRSRFKTTLIKKGTKVDNLVQIGHGVIIGEHNLIVSQTGIAGSAKTGNHVVLAGQCAIVGHVSVTDGTVIAGRGAVTKSIRKPGRYGGAPILPAEDFYKQEIHLKNIDKYVRKLKALETKVQELEKISETQAVS